jgi:hypothetical protein
MVNSELQDIEDREYGCFYRGNQIIIQPAEEKSFVEVTTK